MKPIRVLIVDDEELCRKGIRLQLDKDDEFDVVGECTNGEEAIKAILEMRPEIVFLDIQMPEINGFEVLKRIGSENWPVVVFVTAYDEHAVSAFEVHALDYVLKPFTKDRFKKSLDKVKQTVRQRDAGIFLQSLMKMMAGLESREAPVQITDPGTGETHIERILVKDRGGHSIVWVKDIEWIEGADYYVHLHCKGKSHLYRERLKNLEAKLAPDAFFRVHKSAIINLGKLDKIIADYKSQVFAIMHSGAKVKISRNRKQEFFDLCRDKYGLKA